jgi:hypothetical protein
MSNTTIFNRVIQTIKKLIALNVLFLAFMSLFCLAFFLYFGDMKAMTGLWNYVFQTFVMAIRFDLSAPLYINSLVVLTLLIVLALRKEIVWHGWLIGIKH